MINVLLNGKRYHCPSCREELKTRQYLRILKEFDFQKDIAEWNYWQLFSILTDTDFKDYAHTIENDLAIFDCVAWVYSLSFDKARPKVLTFPNTHRLIQVPDHPGELSIGQNIHLRRDYLDKSKTIEENIAIATAIFLQPLIDNKKFDMKRAKEICKQVEEMPAYQIYPLGFFLLKRAMKFGQKPEKLSPLDLTSLKQTLKGTLRGWLKSTN
jgi:hypothetical protein